MSATTAIIEALSLRPAIPCGLEGRSGALAWLVVIVHIKRNVLPHTRPNTTRSIIAITSSRRACCKVRRSLAIS